MNSGVLPVVGLLAALANPPYKVFISNWDDGVGWVLCGAKTPPLAGNSQ